MSHQDGSMPLNYMVPLEGQPSRSGETPVFRSTDPKIDAVRARYANTTLHENYTNFKNLPEAQKFCYRKTDPVTKQPTSELAWMTNTEFMAQAEHFGSGILGLNLAPEVREYRDFALRIVGFYARQTIEYFIADVACGLYGLSAAPIYDTLGEEATLFAFRQTGMEVCVISCKHVAPILALKRTKSELAKLRTLIITDPENWTEDYKIGTQIDGLQIKSFDEIVKFGRSNTLPWAKVTPKSIYAFSYTSGTTGEPKGAMISHEGLMSIFATIDPFLNATIEDIHYSYLPMAHIMERILFNTFLRIGGQMCLSSGNLTQIKEELAMYRPTVFVSVPRLYNRFYDAIMSGVRSKGCLAQALFNRALKVKLHNLHTKAEYHHWFWDRLVFNKVKEVLGGRVRVMACGSAPISSEVMDSLKVIFGCPIGEGYGQTECSGVSFLTSKHDGSSGHVGGVTSILDFKLVDVPEMNYTSEDKDKDGRPTPRGEIWVRGQSVIPGYYKQDAQNKESFTEDGWLKSGDIGAIVGPQRRLKIIDRKKNIFKLAQGEYIAPEKLENIYKLAHPSISNIYVYGDSLKSHLVAILNVEPPALAKFAADLGISETDPNVLTKNEKIIKEYLKILDSAGKAKKLNSLERVKALFIETRTLQSLGLLTEAMKTKRHEVKKLFENELNALYEEK